MEIIPESLLIKKIQSTSTHSPLGIVASNAIKVATSLAKHFSEQSSSLTEDVLTSIDSPETSKSIIYIMDQLANSVLNGSWLITLSSVLIVTFIIGIAALVTTRIIYFAKNHPKLESKKQESNNAKIEQSLNFESLESTRIENSIGTRLPQCPNDTGRDI